MLLGRRMIVVLFMGLEFLLDEESFTHKHTHDRTQWGGGYNDVGLADKRKRFEQKYNV